MVKSPDEEEHGSADGIPSQRPSIVRSCRLRLLAIDDDPEVLNRIEQLSSRHEVTSIRGGYQALAVLESRRFDAVLCDVTMPDVSGIGVYEYVARLFPGEQGRIIFMVDEAISEGARAFLSGTPNPRIEKPLTSEALERALASALTSPLLGERIGAAAGR